MNSEEQTAPPQGVAVVTTPKGEQHRKRSGRRRRRRRRGGHQKQQGGHSQHTATHRAPEERPPVTEGTELHQARQNHSTYDRDLHHRARGGTGYGLRRDYESTPEELSGRNIPESLLPSYAHSLWKCGVKEPEPEPTPTFTDSEQEAWEEQQMREAHEKDQLNNSTEN